MFTIKPNAEPRVTVMKECLPKVYINASALAKMQLYVDGCADEIGWLGTAYRSGSVVTIDDVYLFDQEVHSTTTEITPDGLSSFGEAILSDPLVDGMEIWNNLKMWGHSHVNMGVTPSGQDDAQMNFFASTGHDWFLRLIANKRGELRVDLYDYHAGITYNDMAWEVSTSGEENTIYSEIDALYAKLDLLRDARLARYKASIDSEITDKVKKKTYGYQVNKPNGTSNIPAINGMTREPQIGTSKKKDTGFEDFSKNSGLITWTGSDMAQFFDYCFNWYDLVDMQDLQNVDELADYIYETVGYFLYDYQLTQLWQVIQGRLNRLAEQEINSHGGNA